MHQNFLLVIFLLFSVIAVDQYDIFLKRYSHQDLFWNDLQISNIYRWYRDAFHDSFWTFLGANIDFLQGSGQTAQSIKHPNALLDIGFWLSFIFGNNVAIALRYLFFVTLFLLGIQSLVKKYDQTQYALLKVVLLFGCGIVSPIFYFEVGILNQYILFLVPLILYSLIGSIEATGKKLIRTLSLLILLILLAIGVCDLFIFSHIAALFLFVFIIHPRCFVKLFFLGLICLIPLLISYINLLLIQDSKYPFFVTHESVFGVEEYWLVYLKTLFGIHIPKSPFFAPSFTGPVTMYITPPVIILLLALYLQNKKSRSKTNLLPIKASFIVVVILFLLGICAHLFIALPSAIRYHLQILPYLLIASLCMIKLQVKIRFIYHAILFLLPVYFLIYLSETFVYIFSVCLLALVFSHEFLNRADSQKIVNKHTFIFSVGLFVISVLILTIHAEKERSAIGYGYKIDGRVRQYFTKDLPQCVADSIKRIHGEKDTYGSVVFVGESDVGHRARDDSLMFLIEQPELLKLRTYNRWRYSLSYLDITLPVQYGFAGLFGFAYPARKLDEVIDFMKKTHANFLISSTQLDHQNLEQIAFCKNNISDLVQFTLRNDTYVYQLREFNHDLFNATFTSTSAIFRIDNKDDSREYQLPINYFPSLEINSFTGAVNSERTLLRSETGHAFIRLPKGQFVIKISSYSNIIFIKNIFLLSTFLLSLITLLALRKN